MSHNYPAVVNLKREVPLVALGGIGGAGVRMLFSELPIDTYQSLLIINLLGAFMLGILLTFTTSRAVRLFWGTGVLGGFTTTSALAVTTFTEFETAPYFSLGYLAVTLYGGLLLFRFAERLGRHA